MSESESQSERDGLCKWIATAPIGAVSVLAEELASFGAVDIRERSYDVKFKGPLEVGYRACLWSRTATRVLLRIGTAEAGSTDSLYESLKHIDWPSHLSSGATLACGCSGGNAAIRHTIYGSQLLKDAVCDSLRERTTERPVIRPERPDVLLHMHVEGAAAEVSVDFSGESLHRRGYRGDGGPAPLKENVAAAILLRAGWQALSERGSLIDPLCGSGTLLIEAALIAADAAPSIDRGYFGFLGWRGHDAALWDSLCAEARARRAARSARRCIYGSDLDAAAVRRTLAAAGRAEVSEWLAVEQRELAAVSRPVGADAGGLLVTNPPYGARIGAASGLPGLYERLGRSMREQFLGWHAAILTGDAGLAKHLGLFAKRTHRVFNGDIECRLLRFEIDPALFQRPAAEVRADWSARPGAKMFANRLTKNLRALAPWARAEEVHCFRAYDADMPEYSFAIDVYGESPRHVHVQEYQAPKGLNEDGVRARRREVLAVLPEVLSVPTSHVHLRLRTPQKGAAQYRRRDHETTHRDHGAIRHEHGSARGDHEVADRLTVLEGGLKFCVNLEDYLDTGLFLDHRITRALLRGWAARADFLNLFCYTGSATVYAAAGGARSTVSVDLSNTYLEWARSNLHMNGLDGAQHELVRADCLPWLENQTAEGRRFDLIFLDPPTFSNSKRMTGVLDVQRDHVGMIRRSEKLLRPGGQLLFSTNHSRFKLDSQGLSDLDIDDITAQTIPRDFARNPRIHSCYLVRAKRTAA